ncbi:hypothetical protein LX87_00980 [Larkinella arboricola]|uniref:Uncharacterized protein n=1 Tax=Larkinella arboricola TaxID=643671 RepID=A0A327X847_LARAB|nr:hypothetical protein [Larkinella arboricola]RAK02859.1 hypothetical protein LX87_00980 [Larkinella arboricola]
MVLYNLSRNGQGMYNYGQGRTSGTSWQKSRGNGILPDGFGLPVFLL